MPGVVVVVILGEESSVIMGTAGVGEAAAFSASITSGVGMSVPVSSSGEGGDVVKRHQMLT